MELFLFFAELSPLFWVGVILDRKNNMFDLDFDVVNLLLHLFDGLLDLGHLFA